jgi:hypothetical protein
MGVFSAVFLGSLLVSCNNDNTGQAMLQKQHSDVSILGS